MALSAQLVRTLVIDDDAVMREVLCALLASGGYDVQAAETGEAGLALLRGGFAAEVVLTDLQLPGIAGAALAAELRRAAPGVRLLAMSGSEPAAEERAVFDAFLLKPFSTEDFTAAVVTTQPTSKRAGRDAVPLDEATYSRLSSAMPPARLAELYQLTQDDIAGRLVTMRDALAAQDNNLYRREAHALKGGCGMVGATELASLAACAEEGSFADTPALPEFSAAAQRLRSIIAQRFLVH